MTSKATSPTPSIPSFDRLRLRLESCVADDTIDRYLRGDPLKDASRLRIERAAEKLGIALPPRRSAQ